MKHDFIDKYAELDSVIHRLDPRIKIISFFSFIFFVISTQPPRLSIIFAQPSEVLMGSLKFLFYFLLIFSVILVSKVPLRFVFKRSLVIIPFVLLIAIFIPFLKEGEIAGSYSFASLHLNVTYTGLETLFNVLSKSWLSVLSMLALASTTKFPRLLKGFEKLGMPRVMVMIVSFMYRYVFVLGDEVMRMKCARDARSFGGNSKWHIETVGNIIGTLFVRTYERGERVYVAMVSRGFSGKIKILDDLHVKKLDLCFVISFLTFLTMIWAVL